MSFNPLLSISGKASFMSLKSLDSINDNAFIYSKPSDSMSKYDKVLARYNSKF
ncbi:MAG: hypothetical protein AB7U85_11270 [Alphaproteobacteria bacterium]